MTASQNVVLELKKLGIELNIAPGKLKNGHGEDVCTVLTKLCEISLKNKFKFKKFEGVALFAIKVQAVNVRARLL